MYQSKCLNHMLPPPTPHFVINEPWLPAPCACDRSVCIQYFARCTHISRFKWQSKCNLIPSTSKISSKNIVHITPGPLGNALFSNEPVE